MRDRGNGRAAGLFCNLIGTADMTWMSLARSCLTGALRLCCSTSEVLAVSPSSRRAGFVVDDVHYKLETSHDDGSPLEGWASDKTKLVIHSPGRASWTRRCIRMKINIRTRYV